MPSEPDPPAAPAAPDYAAANREAVYADIETLPDRRLVEQAAKLGTKVTLSNGKVADFTGLGDSVLQQQQSDLNISSADKTAAAILELQKKYGADFNAEQLKRIQESDPAGYAARQKLAQQTLDDLNLGSSLDPESQREIEQSVRGAQVARGNALGNASAVAEAYSKGTRGQQMKQQRMSNASAYVLGTPITAQYGAVSGAQNGAAPYSPVNYNTGVSLNPGAGQSGVNFANSVYGTQAGIWSTQANLAANQGSPLMQGLGVLGGMGSSILGGMASAGAFGGAAAI